MIILPRQLEGYKMKDPLWMLGNDLDDDEDEVVEDPDYYNDLNGDK